jgi:ribosomal-protein-alanine N-acetyltransferase
MRTRGLKARPILPPTLDPDTGMFQITLRDGTPADIEALYALDLLCFDEPFRFDIRSMRRYATSPGAIVLVGEIANEIAGFIIVNPTRRRSLHAAYITTLDVHPDHRRQGIAHQLLAEAEHRAAVSGATSMQLHVHTCNVAAIRFYESAGYQQAMLTPDFYAAGLDAWTYLKPLQ